MTSANVERFNAEAAAWDSNPTVLLASKRAHTAILERLPGPEITSLFDVLDLGCGTGILSLELATSVRSVTAIDAAEGMITALNAKLAAAAAESNSDSNSTASKASNVRAVCALLTDPDDPRIRPDPAAVTPGATAPGQPRRFDLVVSHLVLHHIPDLLPVLRTMLGLLKPGGQVMLTDFEDFGPAARRFHPEHKMDGVERHGVKKADMEALLREAGFADVAVETVFEIEKAVETEPGSGAMRDTMTFPFLMLRGGKPRCATVDG